MKLLTTLAAGALLAGLAAAPALAAPTPVHRQAPARMPVPGRHALPGKTYRFEDWPGGRAGAGSIFVNGRRVVTSRTNATVLTVTSLNVHTGITQLVEPSGACLAPFNTAGTWYVGQMSARKCANRPARSRWLVFGSQHGPYGFDNIYQLESGACPNFEGPVLQSNGAGKRMTSPCSPLTFGDAAQLFLAIRPAFHVN